MKNIILCIILVLFSLFTSTKLKEGNDKVFNLNCEKINNPYQCIITARHHAENTISLSSLIDAIDKHKANTNYSLVVDEIDTTQKNKISLISKLVLLIPKLKTHYFVYIGYGRGRINSFLLKDFLNIFKIKNLHEDSYLTLMHIPCFITSFDLVKKKSIGML